MSLIMQNGQATRAKLSSLKALNAFSLIELLMVLAILSILISVAVPSYQAFNLKSQRTEGKALLLEIQNQMERYYFHYNAYPERLSQLRAYQTDTLASENVFYQVSIDKPKQNCPPERCYLIVAKHKSAKQQEELSLHSSGKKDGPW